MRRATRNTILSGLICAMLAISLVIVAAYFETVHIRSESGLLLGILIISLALIAGCFYLLQTDIRRNQTAESETNRFHSETEDLYNNAPCGYLSVDSSSTRQKTTVGDEN